MKLIINDREFITNFTSFKKLFIDGTLKRLTIKQAGQQDLVVNVKRKLKK